MHHHGKKVPVAGCLQISAFARPQLLLFLMAGRLPLLLTSLCALSIAPAFAGESIKFADRPGAVRPAKPEAGRSEEKPFDSLSPSDSIGAVLETPRSPMLSSRPNARTQKQQADERDRQKNWIFPTAEKEEEPVNLQELFDVQTDPLGLDDKKRQKVIERFLEEFDGKKDKDGKNKDRDGHAARILRPRNADPNDRDYLAEREDSTDFDHAREKDRKKEERFGISNVVMQDEPLVGENIRSPLGSVRNDLFGSEAANRIMQKKNQPGGQSELDKFLSPKTAAGNGPGVGLIDPKSFGALDPINLFSDTTRQSLNPVVGINPEEGARKANPFGAPAPANFSAPNPALTGLDRVGSGFLGQSSYGPSISAPAPPLRAPPKPIILELPTRKF